MPDMLELIKLAAMGAVNASKPVSLVFGEVTGVSPLEISVEQRLVLNAEQLVLTSNVRDYELEMTVSHFTGESDSHFHIYEGRKKFLVHNGLAVGDCVMMLQMQGGQNFVVLDKVVNI